MPYRRQFYISALDGLRALAVLAVFAYHVDERRFPGGFLGVDLFFVISGYVITLGLLDEWQARGSIDLRHFWWRRVRRLMPAAIALILGTLAITSVTFPERMASLRGEAAAALGYVANWYLVFHRMPYFETLSAPSMLRHLWSLAVEEQFYLLWPPLLTGALRVMRPRWAFAGTVLLAVASAAWLGVLYEADASADRLYYGTDTRGFALLGGAALAFVWKPRLAQHTFGLRDAVSGFVGVVCLAAFAALCWRLNGATDFMYRGGLALAALVSLGAVAMCARADNAYTRLLASAPLRWLGKRSYSAYLWHWPVVLLLPVQDALAGGVISTVAVYVAAAACTLAAAEVSYRWIETPFREGRVLHLASAWREARGARRGVVLTGATLSAIAVLSLSVTVARARVPEPPSYLSVPKLSAVLTAESVGALPPAVPVAASTVSAEQTPAAESMSPASVVGPLPEGVTLDGPGVLAQPAPIAPVAPTPTFVLPPGGEFVTAIGDSVMLGAAHALARALGVVDLDAEAGRSASAVVDVLRQRAAVGRVGSVVVIQVGDNGALRADRLDDALDLLSGARRVVVVNLRVPRAWEAPNNSILAEAVARHPNAVLVDWHAASEGRGDYLYDDQIHLKPEGAAVYASLIAQAIAR